MRLCSSKQTDSSDLNTVAIITAALIVGCQGILCQVAETMVMRICGPFAALLCSCYNRAMRHLVIASDQAASEGASPLAPF